MTRKKNKYHPCLLIVLTYTQAKNEFNKQTPPPQKKILGSISALFRLLAGYFCTLLSCLATLRECVCVCVCVDGSVLFACIGYELDWLISRNSVQVLTALSFFGRAGCHHVVEPCLAPPTPHPTDPAHFSSYPSYDSVSVANLLTIWLRFCTWVAVDDVSFFYSGKTGRRQVQDPLWIGDSDFFSLWWHFRLRVNPTKKMT